MDVETNPGPNTAESTVSEMEFQKLARDIPPSYEAAGRSLDTGMELLERSVPQPFVGKRVICTPYVLPPVGKVLYLCLLLCIHDDETDHNQKRKEEMKGYMRLYPPQQMLVEWTCGDIVIKLFDGRNGNEKEICEKKLSEKDIYLWNWKYLSFEVKPLESGASQKFLKFTLNQTKSPYDPTVIKFIVPYNDIRTTAAAGVSMPSRIDLESDGVLDTLSKYVPHKTYTTLCRHLGIGYDEANSILAKFNMDYQIATRDCLAKWKTRTSGDMAELKTILVAAGVRDLVKYVK